MLLLHLGYVGATSRIANATSNEAALKMRIKLFAVKMDGRQHSQLIHILAFPFPCLSAKDWLFTCSGVRRGTAIIWLGRLAPDWPLAFFSQSLLTMRVGSLPMNRWDIDLPPALNCCRGASCLAQANPRNHIQVVSNWITESLRPDIDRNHFVIYKL